MDAQTDSPTSADRKSPQALIEREEIRSILSHLSHELCRPLVSLRMGFDLLLAEGASPISNDQRGHVQTMVVLCDDLLRLTRSYLDYAGLVEGTRPLSFGAFTLGALIREIDRQFRPCAGKRRIDWGCTLDGSDATVKTDASLCQQIFANLVSNALKYTPEGGEIHVSARYEESGWLVNVADNGPGIPAEHIDRVFEPFYRIARDEHARDDGNGLGLAICREMVGQLGGEISIQSGTGQGTRVTVRFPIDADELSPPAKRRR